MRTFVSCFFHFSFNPTMWLYKIRALLRCLGFVKITEMMLNHNSKPTNFIYDSAWWEYTFATLTINHSWNEKETTAETDEWKIILWKTYHLWDSETLIYGDFLQAGQSEPILRKDKWFWMHTIRLNLQKKKQVLEMSRWKLHDIAEEVGKFCVCVRETALSYIHTWPLDILHHGTDDKYLINSSKRHSLCLMDRRCWGASIAIFLPTSIFPLTIKQLGSLSWRMIIIIIIIILSNNTDDHHAAKVRGVALLLATFVFAYHFGFTN